MWYRAVAILMLVAMVAAPAASAYPRPALYFLRDGELGPAEDGQLDIAPPNATEPTLRPVPVGAENVKPVLFRVLDAEERPRRVYGPLFVGLWTDASPLLDANLTATVYRTTGDQLDPLAMGQMNLQADPEKAPNATTLVPPDPSDPEGAALYEVAQITPLVLTPPKLIYLGQVDVQLEEGDGIAVGFALTNSSENPVPLGLFAMLRYDATLSPSYAFIPWYAPDPPRTSNPGSFNTPPRGNPRTASSTGSPGGNDGGDSPGIEAVLALLLVGAAAFTLRRRRA